MANAAIKRITIDQLAVPLRRTVSHAASQRRVSEPIVVTVELNSGVLGFGETLPRSYVTGESVASATKALEHVYFAHLLEAHPGNFPDALELIDALPWQDRTGKGTPAARAAIELALLDAYAKHFRRSISQVAGWMGLNAFGPPGSVSTVRHSGVLTDADASSCVRTLRKLWWFGVRDFKLKVGDANEQARFSAVTKYLARPLASGRATLRLDANGAWSLDQAIARLSAWRDVKIASVEQPLARGAERELADLKSATHPPLMYDESLVTLEDAERLIELRVVDAFNIRISKCGGLLPSLRLACLARRNGIMVQLGCMVGETSILSAAGRRFLEWVPAVRFAEGSFGSFLVTEDVVRRPLRFGYGGRIKPLPDVGLGVDVRPERIEALRVCTQSLVM